MKSDILKKILSEEYPQFHPQMCCFPEELSEVIT